MSHASGAGQRVLLPYLASEPTTETFKPFLQTHAELLSVAPTWTIRIVFPRPRWRERTGGTTGKA